MSLVTNTCPRRTDDTGLALRIALTFCADHLPSLISRMTLTEHTLVVITSLSAKAEAGESDTLYPILERIHEMPLSPSLAGLANVLWTLYSIHLARADLKWVHTVRGTFGLAYFLFPRSPASFPPSFHPPSPFLLLLPNARVRMSSTAPFPLATATHPLPSLSLHRVPPPRTHVASPRATLVGTFERIHL